MSFIPLDVTGVKEPKALSNGRYNLSISSAEEGVSREKKKPMITAFIAVEGHADSPNVRHNISLPAPDDEEKSKVFKMLLLKRFLALFSIPYDANGFNVDDFVGATATNAELRLTEVDEKGNQYNELVLPKMPGEVKGPTAVARPPAAQKTA